MTNLSIVERLDTVRTLIIEANKEISDLRKELMISPDNEFTKAAIEMIQEINREQRNEYKSLLALNSTPDIEYVTVTFK